MRRSIPTRTLALVALGAIGWFLATEVILPIVQRDQYNVVLQTMSELALGRLGWLQNLAFCVLGVGTLSLAIAVHRLLAARVAAAVLIVAGLLDGVSALYHAVRMGDPATLSSTIHTAAGISTFVLTYAAMFALVRPMRHHPAWRTFAPANFACAVVGAAGFIVFAPPAVGPTHFGIGQRLMAATLLSWMLATATRASHLTAALKGSADQGAINRRTYLPPPPPDDPPAHAATPTPTARPPAPPAAAAATEIGRTQAMSDLNLEEHDGHQPTVQERMQERA